MKHLVSNGYIQYAFLLLSLLRHTRMGLDDTIFNGLRRRIRSKELVKEQIEGGGKEEFVEVLVDKPVGWFGKWLRDIFGCHWCLPPYTCALLIPLTFIFPIPMTYWNIFWGTTFLVSVLYKKYA